MLILHLSDLHFGPHSRIQGDEEELPLLATRFVEELKRGQDQTGIQGSIDLVIVSGDVAESAKPIEFAKGSHFLTALAEQLSLEPDRFVFVPGNHDVSWFKCNKAEADYSESLESQRDSNPDELRRCLNAVKLQPYIDFLTGFYGVSGLDQLKGCTALDCGAYLRDFSPHLPISVAALNSCERESHRAEDHVGEVSEKQAVALMDAWQREDRKKLLKVMVVHHNPSVTTEANIEARRDSVRESKAIDAKLLERYETDLVGLNGRQHLRSVAEDCSVQLVLHGHHHAADDNMWRWNDPGAAHVLSAGSFALKDGKLPGREPCSVLLIHLDAEHAELRAHSLVYEHRFRMKGSLAVGGFVPDPARPEGYRQNLHLPDGFRLDAPKPSKQPSRKGAQADITPYLRHLHDLTSHIDIRGLSVGSGKAMRFPIQELYISLTTALHGEPRPAEKEDREEIQQRLQEKERHVDLVEALRNRRLVIVGDPGAGKTTFLRRLANLICKSRLEGDLEAVRQTLGLEQEPLPVLIRLSEFQQHRETAHGRPDAPSTLASVDWLAHFLQTDTQECRVGLTKEFLISSLQDGQALVMLDGLDEAPTRTERRSVSDWIQEFADTFRNCPIVVTCRPAAYREESVLPGFAHVQIDDLQDEAIKAFLTRWTGRLFHDDQAQAKHHLADLLSALQAREEIRHLARNPVMLTALAVVHWNEKRMPEQRAELYDSILAWLSRSREMKPGRLKPDRALKLLQNLALAMQDHPDGGRQVQVTRHWAAQAVAPDLREVDELERVAAAEAILEKEEEDSGIVVGRGNQLRFWHLTFQEHLAARALAARPDKEWRRVLFDQANFYRPEWREVILLLGGVMHNQGVERVDDLFLAVLQDAEAQSGLEEQARAAGLLGSILQDLSIVQYRAPDQSRYERLLRQCMAVFDRTRSGEVSIEVAIEAAEAIGQAGDPRLSAEQSSRNWVEIPAGEFWMGAQKADSAQPNYDPQADFYLPEGPVHKVWLDAYRIGRYPVTVAEYERFVEAGGYADRRCWEAGGFEKWPAPWKWASQLKHPSRPVTGVSWFEASAYARWARVRLPTEAEWEKAARGEGAQKKCPWGDSEPSAVLLNYQGNVGNPTPVGVYPQGTTPAGVSDLAGNVWEWCQDWHADYPSQPQKNPTGPKKGKGRVLRGGAWGNYAGCCRCAFRYGDVPSERLDLFGFRVVLVSSSARTKKRKS